MRDVQFTKAHGLGNDFLIIDVRGADQPDWSQEARAWCDRRFGVGADGLLLLTDDPSGAPRMRIVNSDGSECEMCGNGIRCFAKYCVDNDVESTDEFTVQTLAGPRIPKLIDYSGGPRATVSVDMGVPRLHPDEIPFRADPGADRVVSAYIQVDEEPWTITAVSMGNPHCVIFVDDVAHMRTEWFGPAIECHERFPQKTNVEFATVNARDDITMRVWERGAGRTLACGTGACATLVAAVLNDRADRQATVHLEGGDLSINWRADTGHVILTGPAVTVFTGHLTA